jgi:urease accessory protein
MAADSPDTDEGPPDGPPTPPTRDGESPDEPPHPAFAAYATESVPAAAVGSPGKDGRLKLRFEVDGDGETNLVRDLARAPFHVSGTLGHDPLSEAETVYVQSPTGGVAQGDRHDVTVEVRSGAVAHVSTQSSQKVLSMARNYAAADLSLSVGSGGHLDYVPEPTILHEDSRFSQGVDLELAPDASAVVGEVVVPGRLARGERFDFERYLSRLRVRRAGKLLVDDATHLRPADADPSAPGVMGKFAVLGTLYVLTPAGDDAPGDARACVVATQPDTFERCRAGFYPAPRSYDRSRPDFEYIAEAWGEWQQRTIEFRGDPVEFHTRTRMVDEVSQTYVSEKKATTQDGDQLFAFEGEATLLPYRELELLARLSPFESWHVTGDYTDEPLSDGHSAQVWHLEKTST